MKTKYALTALNMTKITAKLSVITLILAALMTTSIAPNSISVSHAQSFAKPTPVKKLKNSSNSKGAGHFNSPHAFIEAILPHAIKAGKALGVDPKVILAQAALESNWGRSIPKHSDNTSSYNLFGLKYSPKAGGKAVKVQTHEYRKGKKQATTAKFRAYDNFAHAFEDYIRLIQRPFYQKNLQNVKTPADYAQGLQRTGYATDPKYAKEIMATYHNPIIKKVKLSS